MATEINLQSLRAGRVGKKVREEFLAYLHASKPQAIPTEGWIRWLERVSKELHGTTPTAHRIGYVVSHKINTATAWHEEILVAAVGKRNLETRTASFKAVVLKRSMREQDVSLVLSMLIDKICTDCHKDGFPILTVTTFRTSAACPYLIASPQFSVARHSRMYGDEEEFTFLRELQPLFTGDPCDWQAWCKWFVEKFLHVSDAQVDNFGEITYSWDFRPGLLAKSNMNSKVAWPAQVIVANPTDDLPNVLKRIQSLDLNSAVVLSKQSINLDRCPVVSLDDLLSANQAIFFDEHRTAISGDESLKKRLLERVLDIRVARPAREVPAGLLVDITFDNLDRLTKKSAILTATDQSAHLVYFMGAPVGKSVAPGGPIYFYAWDYNQHGSVRAKGFVKSVGVYDPNEAFQLGDDHRSAFDSHEDAANYFSRKESVLRVEFEDLSVTDSTSMDYEWLCRGVLGLQRANEEEIDSRTLLQLFPNEDVGHTYLFSEQVAELDSTGDFREPDHGDIQPSGASAETLALVSAHDEWTADMEKKLSFFAPSAGAKISAHSIRKSLVSAVDVGGPAGLAALQWVMERITSWTDERILVGYQEAIRKLLDVGGPSSGDWFFCPLGGTEDSAQLLTRTLAEARRSILGTQGGAGDSFRSLTDTLKLLLRQPQPATVILYDDICASGLQLVDVIQQWLGGPLALNEDHVLPLDLAESVLLRQLPVYVLYLCGPKDHLAVETEVKRILPRFQSIVSSLDLSEYGCFHPLSVENSQKEAATQAKTFFERVGYELMKQDGGPKVPMADQFALGYRNSGQLIVFPHNVPTCTLTALWKTGTINGKPWHPVFKRRKGKPTLGEGGEISVSVNDIIKASEQLRLYASWLRNVNIPEDSWSAHLKIGLSGNPDSRSQAEAIDLLEQLLSNWLPLSEIATQ